MSGHASAPSLSQQIVTYISYPFASCLPSSSSRQSNNHERHGLLSEATTSYDDSDAISLLSNIRDRSRRRSRSSRRREDWNKRAAIVGCGLFGRPKGQIGRREVTDGDGLRSQHQRSASQDSIASRTSDDLAGTALSASGSLGGTQESGDEDAGMLGDEDIAEISQSREEDEAEGSVQQTTVPTVHVSAAEESGSQREEDERAALKAKLDQEAEVFANAQVEDAARLAAEEKALADEEEAAAAKAKRRAERRARKEELANMQSHSQKERRRTEAEAEAAAGGFDFGEEVQRNDHVDYDYQQGEEPPRYGMPKEDHDYGYMQASQIQQPEVVHHHHYYHEPQPEDEEAYDDSLLSPNFRIQEVPAFVSVVQDTKETTFEEDEDDADIAGLTFSKKKKSRSRGGEGSSQTHSNGGRSNGSGSGSWQSGSANGGGQSRFEAYRRASDQSGEGGSGAGGGSSASGKRNYRDRPRRHEKTESRSTGSGPGTREGVLSRAIDRSSTNAESEGRAEAAAGGFDDFVPPSNAFSEEQDTAGYRARERRSFGEQGSTGSSSQRRERRREGPTKGGGGGGLNQARNPLGANIFVRGREEADDF